MCAVELVAERSTKTPFPPSDKVGPRVHQRALELGMVSRVKGDSYLLAPPIVITNEQIDRCVEILARAVTEVLS